MLWSQRTSACAFVLLTCAVLVRVRVLWSGRDCAVPVLWKYAVDVSLCACAVVVCPAVDDRVLWRGRVLWTYAGACAVDVCCGRDCACADPWMRVAAVLPLCYTWRCAVEVCCGGATTCAVDVCVCCACAVEIVLGAVLVRVL